MTENNLKLAAEQVQEEELLGDRGVGGIVEGTNEKNNKGDNNHQ